MNNSNCSNLMTEISMATQLNGNISKFKKFREFRNVVDKLYSTNCPLVLSIQRPASYTKITPRLSESRVCLRYKALRVTL